MLVSRILPRTRLIPVYGPCARRSVSIPTLGGAAKPKAKAAAKPTPPPRAFTRESLNLIRDALDPPPTTPMAELPLHTMGFGHETRMPKDAAVLIPLCNVAGQATILMEIRAGGLKVHANEAGFPGGKAEPSDENLVESALRETEEELSLPMSNVEVLGSLPPEYSLGNRARVWPVVGFVHSGDAIDAATDDALETDKKAIQAALPSISLSTLKPEEGEVSAILPLPLSSVADPSRQVAHYFRLDGHRPYWKIRCGDYVLPPPEEPEPLEVWGLSGWFLSRLALRMGWSDTPPQSLPPQDD